MSATAACSPKSDLLRRDPTAPARRLDIRKIDVSEVTNGMEIELHADPSRSARQRVCEVDV